MTMRVLIVTDWPALEAGTERSVQLLRDGLRAGGDEVRLLTSSVGSSARGSAEYVAYGTTRRSQQVGLQVVNPSAVWTMRKALAEFSPDAVHVNMCLQHLSPAILAPLGRFPALLQVHDYKSVCPKGTKLLPDGSPCRTPGGLCCWRGGCLSLPRFARDVPRYGLFRHWLHSVDRVFAISRWLQYQLDMVGIEAERTDPPVRPPAPGFERRPSPTPLFVYAGRLAPVKGVDVLLRAFAVVHDRVPEARLRVVGDGPDRDSLHRLADDLGVARGVSFSFTMEPDWVHELQPAWALVAPSTYEEPLGLVAIEAIIHGVSVIASDGGGFRETVRPGLSGKLVPRGDVPSLAEAMLEVARRDRPPEVQAETSAELARLHDPAAHAAAMHAVMAEVAEEVRAA
jgi:glycosyltransferase involved in cell wall biosynthesis